MTGLENLSRASGVAETTLVIARNALSALAAGLGVSQAAAARSLLKGVVPPREAGGAWACRLRIVDSRGELLADTGDDVETLPTLEAAALWAASLCEGYHKVAPGHFSALWVARAPSIRVAIQRGGGATLWTTTYALGPVNYRAIMHITRALTAPAAST